MKLIIQAILILTLLFYPVVGLAGPLEDEILRIAPQYVGFRESWGDNKGPEVNKILASVGLPPGNPWCMSLVYYVNDQASKNIGVSNKVLKTGLSSGYLVYANKRKLTYRVVTAKQILLGAKMQPGSTGIFRRGEVRGDGTFKGHANIVLEQLSNKSFKGLDGNTGSDDKGDQGEGDGSFIKVRKIGMSNFPFVAAIEIR